jgi:hypothetical protein
MLENIKFKKYISQIDNKIAKYTKYTTKYILISIITIFIIIYSCLLIYRYFRSGSVFGSGSNSSSNGNNEIPVVKRPFLNLYAVMKDGRDVLTNIVFITHSFTRDDCEVDYNNYKSKGIHFLGLSSYSEFPGPISNPHDVLHDPKHKAYTFNYFDLTRGWCTVFREENNKKWIKDGFPKLQIAESDFANYENHVPDPNVKKEYDFIYICLKDGEKKETDKDCPEGWQSVIRKFDIAKKLIDIMCTKYKLKGLLVGRIGCEVPPSCHQLMELTDFQEYHTFISNFNKSKFILTTSEADASPRSLTEAMCFNLPALVNKKILGGWQYINDETGEFFDPDNLDGFEPILDKFLKKLNNNEYKPREWFIKNYGKYNSGKRLKTFVQSVFKESELNIKYDEVEYMKPGI